MIMTEILGESLPANKKGLGEYYKRQSERKLL